MCSRERPSNFYRSRGIVLPSILWIAILAIVVAANYATSVRLNTRAADNIKMAALARYDAIAGIYVGIEHLLAHRPGDNSDLQLEINGNTVDVEIRPERLKTDINAASRDELLRTFGEAGIDSALSMALAARVVDWRDRDGTTQAHGMEDDEYFAAGKPYGAKDMPISDLLELALMAEVEPREIRMLADYFTVYSYAAGTRFTLTASAHDARGKRLHVTSAVVQIGALRDRPYQIIKWRQYHG